MHLRFLQQKGMTIVEAVVFVSILVVIIGAIVMSLKYTYQGQRFAFEQADATRSARKGIGQAVRFLREASYADDGAYPIYSMSTSSITFFSDYDNDSKIERIRFFLDGTNLKRGIVESSGDPPTYATSTEVVSVVSDNVRNNALGTPLFTYYDSTGTLMSDYTKVADLAYVLVKMVVNIHPERAPDDYELRSSAFLRNIRR